MVISLILLIIIIKIIDDSFSYRPSQRKKVYHTVKETQRKSEKDKYYESLNDERWKKRRKEILERDNYTCQWCGRKNNLQVHHKYYEIYPNGDRVFPWDYPDKALITLCKNCHRWWHDTHKTKTYFRKYGQHHHIK